MSDGNIFISYRRGLDSSAAGRLHDRLERHFDDARLFFDVDAIPLGVDFAEYISDQVAKCDALACCNRNGVAGQLRATA